MSGGRLARKVALVTGASRGIGRAIAVALAREGATVGVHYGSARDAAEETVRLCQEANRAGGAAAFALGADLAAPDGPEVLAASFERALEGLGGEPGFDILVNNAGLGGRIAFDAVTPELFDRVFAVNLKAPFFLIQRLGPRLRAGGRIVNISSMGARAAYADMPVYAPAKAALDVLTRNLALVFGPRGITVNSVMPGATATDMNKAARDPEKARETAKTIALGRVGQPDDIARVVLFLASEEGGWVTGQRLDASGGQRL